MLSKIEQLNFYGASKVGALRVGPFLQFALQEQTLFPRIDPSGKKRLKVSVFMSDSYFADPVTPLTRKLPG